MKSPAREAQPLTEAQEREAFEADWERRNAPTRINIRKDIYGRYATPSVQRDWEEWRAALATHPRTQVAPEDAFEAGWTVAANWAGRGDLLADVGSPAYQRDRGDAMRLLAHPAPSAAPAQPVAALDNLLDWEEAQQGATTKPKTLYVYRWPDGRTQVRAPDITDPADVIDMLQEALRAMTEGAPVRQQ